MLMPPEVFCGGWNDPRYEGEEEWEGYQEADSQGTPVAPE
jgi:hypothetical protein